MKASTQQLQRILRKYASAESIESSLQVMRKLHKAKSALTYREAAELVFLSCGTVAATRTRSALAMARADTPAGSLVRNLENQLRSGCLVELDSMPTAMLREVSNGFKEQSKGRSNVSTPGFLDGRHIQVRGGATPNWKRHAAAYVIKEDTP